MRGQPSSFTLILATLTCIMLASCTGASHRQVAGPPGSPGNPVVLTCDAESWPGGTDRTPGPGPQDLVIGPMYLATGRALATETPAQHGYAPVGRHGRSYKFGMVVRPGATVTVTIGASARGHAVIGIGLPGGVTSATYHACTRPGGFFGQGFIFTHPPFRGCVPLDVAAGGRVLHATLSLFAGPCPA